MPGRNRRPQRRAILVDRIFAGRPSLKDSPHTTAAYRRDLAALATAAGVDLAGVTTDQLSAQAVRDAFGDFSSLLQPR
jgi:hypothetical protein